MKAAHALRIRFWGVRGSYPVPGSGTAGVGGNSSCVEITAPGHTLIFDAGTGIINLGHALVSRNGTRAVHIFFSHTHHDHIEGLRFFQPAYNAEWRCHLYGAAGPHALDQVLSRAMHPQFFPVSLSELPTQLDIRTLGKRERIRFGGTVPVEVIARHSLAHPKLGVMLYRVRCGGRSVVYATDVEAPKGGYEDVVELARKADVLIHDAQYTDAEYHEDAASKAGWGHSTVRMAAEVAKAAGVGELILYHHDPLHDDREIHRLERLAQSIFPSTRAATEGLEIQLTLGAAGHSGPTHGAH